MNRKTQALQILRQLARRHHSVKNAILDELGLTDADLDAVDAELFSDVLSDLDECGCCGGYHRPDFYGDCRNDAERF